MFCEQTSGAKPQEYCILNYSFLFFAPKSSKCIFKKISKEKRQNNTFPTDLGSGNRIPTQGKVKKIPPQGAKRRGEEFFDLPEGGNSIPTPQIRRE